MTKKKSIVIILAVVMVAVLVVLGVRFFILDAKNVEIPEQFEGINWDVKMNDARYLLELEGYIFKGTNLTVFDIENFGGYEGANGLGILYDDEYGNLERINIEFNYGTMDEKSFNKFAEKCIEELDEKFDRKVSAETYVKIHNQEMSNVAYDEDFTQIMYFGEVSAITIKYHKDGALTISYIPIDSEYSEEMKSYAE